MRQMEDRFNHWAQYDYVFLNEEVSKRDQLRVLTFAGLLRRVQTVRFVAQEMTDKQAYTEDDQV